MKLDEFAKRIKQIFLVEDTLKLYCYKDKIVCIEYTPEYVLNDGEILDACYGMLGTFYLAQNEDNSYYIQVIENKSLNMITSANNVAIEELTKLISATIEDYDKIEVLKDIDELPSINV